MNRPAQRLGRTLGSLVAIPLLFVLVPAALLAAARQRFRSSNPLHELRPPWRWQSSEVRAAISEPLRDDAVINLLVRSGLVLIWVAVAVMAVTVVIETTHMARHHGLSAPNIRGLGWAQGLSRWIAVGLVALLPVQTVSSPVNALGAQSGPAATALRIGASPASTTTSPSTIVEAPVTVVDRNETGPHGSTHTVRRGESVYGIASSYANGDAARTIEIADAILDLNLGSEMDDGQRFTNPALIQAGWELELPAGLGASNEMSSDQRSHTVMVGDTLSEIAGAELGDVDRWTEIWDANRGEDMGGGRTFDDPNLILPGWKLDVPPDDAPTAPRSSAEPTVTSSTTSPAPTTPPPVDTSPPDVTAVPPIPDEHTVATTTTTSSTTTSSTTTLPSTPQDVDPGGSARPDVESPRAPAPIRLEHAAMLAAGILTLVAVRRRRALRAALPHARIPPPPPDVAAVERRLRTVDPGERSARVDVAIRAAARHLVDNEARIAAVRVGADGEVIMHLTDAVTLPAPWTGRDADWHLPSSMPIELLADDARRVGQPCIAFVAIGLDSEGRDLLVDLEAVGLTSVEAQPDQADAVIRAIGSSLAASLDAEIAHLVVADLGTAGMFDHPNTHHVVSADAAIRTARDLVASTLRNDRTAFDLRARRTGGEMWEPAVVLLTSTDNATSITFDTPPPGRGLAIVAAGTLGTRPRARLVAGAEGWRLEIADHSIEITPFGIELADVNDINDLLVDAARPAQEATDSTDTAVMQPFHPMPHDIVVRLIGGVHVGDRAGNTAAFERSKTVELIAWLATHRDRATRGAARTALWELDVRDATFANVVSEARRGLGRLVAPPPGEEWLARTLNESLPLHPHVVTDSDLIAERVDHARIAPPAHAIDVLRPAVEMIRGLPFADTSYLWPDADGITSNLVLLATTAAAELGAHALSVGDTDLVFWATGHGLKVLPGHEELIGLRMRAHARAGDLAGVRQEWESYERVINADSWSDGEPAPKLLDLRRQLLTSGA